MMDTPAMPNYVGYVRISGGTGQAADGLGVQRQKDAIAAFVAAYGDGGRLLGEYVEVESGAEADRPKLAAALDHCRRTGATLLVDAIDRLGRDAALVIGLGRSGVTFRSTDNPTGSDLITGFKAVIAQEERRLISERTKAALAAAKARGVQLGGWRGGPVVDAALGRAKRAENADAYARRVGPVIEGFAIDEDGKRRSLARMAQKLTAESVVTPQGGQWSAHSVRAVMMRYSALKANG